MKILRRITHQAQKLFGQYPVLTITGPRQSGKTTLVRHAFANLNYASLEDPDMRSYAQSDPRAFLAQYQILDEVQVLPELFSYIQSRVDQSNLPGQFVVTSSQNFGLLSHITQSLAGRTAILEMLPLSLSELPSKPSSYCEVIFRGTYPRLYQNEEINSTQFFKDYYKTYVERDLRQIQNILDLASFQTFLKLCAGRVGQLLNIAALASEASISQATAKQWLSVLHTSYILFLLPPHFANFNKRLVKQPKLYFYDTGLASYLLGIKSSSELETHFAKGALFENFIILEFIKHFFSQGQDHGLYFWRDNHGHELDLLLTHSSTPIPVEIKSSSTIHADFFKNLHYYQNLAKTTEGLIIYSGDQIQSRTNSLVLPWNELAHFLDVIPK